MYVGRIVLSAVAKILTSTSVANGQVLDPAHLRPVLRSPPPIVEPMRPTVRPQVGAWTGFGPFSVVASDADVGAARGRTANGRSGSGATGA